MKFARAEPTWTIWLAMAVAALLWHLLVFWAGPAALGPIWEPVRPRERWTVDPVDAKTLEKIREKWKRIDEGKLLLSKDKEAPADPGEEPRDARYVSDRNRQVEREQQALRQDTLPRAGGPSQEQTREREQTEANPLSRLGIPIPAPADSATAKSSPKVYDGPAADQLLLDEELPVGAENLLNTRRTIYYSFYSRITETIAPIWRGKVRREYPRLRLGASRYVTVLDAVANERGELLRIHLLKKSGVPEFDEAAIQSFLELGELRNPPTPLIDKNGEVHLVYEFTIELTNRNFEIRYLAPDDY